MKYIFLHYFYFSGNAFGNSGEDYFWCPTATSWDYCSPKATSTIQVFSKVRVDKSFKVFHVPLTLIVLCFQSGHLCSGVCDKMGGNNEFCEIERISGLMTSWWDYCDIQV